MRRRGIPEDVALKTALEVASVKAQVQAIIRRLQADLAELEYEVGRLPAEEVTPDDGLDRGGTQDGPGPGEPAK
jgi:hypothetical protein